MQTILNFDSLRAELERRLKEVKRDMERAEKRLGRKSYRQTDHFRIHKRQRDGYERRLGELEVIQFGVL